MGLLKDFSIRAVMLTVLGVLCVLWAAVGGYSVYSLSAMADGNRVDRQLVSQQRHRSVFPLRHPSAPRHGKRHAGR